MRGLKGGILSMAVMLAASATSAQGVPAGQSAPVDLAVTYDALHSNHITAQSFWMQGGAVELGRGRIEGWASLRAWRACIQARTRPRANR
jgi:hypothetical protein